MKSAESVSLTTELCITVAHYIKKLCMFSAEGSSCVPIENDSESQQEATVIYTYPKVIEDFTIT